MISKQHATLSRMAFTAALFATCQVASAATATATATAIATDTVNDSALQTVVDAQAPRDAVLRAQILLDRARYSPGEIDAAYGGNMQLAVAAYQAAQGLPVTGTVDAGTWTALNADAAPALTAYTLVAEDVAGPFVVIPAKTAAKARLKALGYTSAVEALGEKFHASPRLLRELNPDANFSNAGELIRVPNVANAAPVLGTVKVIVDKSDHAVSLVDAAGKVLARYPASTGSERDPLPIGDWKINGIARNPWFNYNPALFWDAAPGSKKAKLAPGPNNPVGVVWMDLSKEHYGIHGTPEPGKIGKTESHGCIRLTNWSASEVATAISAGTLVVLQE